jgi:hypothetical protein
MCLCCVFSLLLVVCKKVPEHNLKVRILPYYEVKGITFWPTHVCTIPLAFGNHKGASLQPQLLQQLTSKDVHFGYCLLLPLRKASKIPGILLAPMNIQKQNTIHELGVRLTFSPSCQKDIYLQVSHQKDIYS